MVDLSKPHIDGQMGYPQLPEPNPSEHLDNKRKA
jgi:hypothetical protein